MKVSRTMNCLPLFSQKERYKKALLLGVLVSASIVGLSWPEISYADTATTHSSNIEKYDANFFMAFEPQTLYDILEKIPGANTVLINVNNASQSRGFGSAGDQILINSKRVSGKENDIHKELNNIQARDVDYVELIRGTKAGLDVQSKGLVVNVILKKQIDSSVLWSIGATKASGLNTKPTGSVVYSAGKDDFKYRFGLNRALYPNKFTSTDQYISPEGELTNTYTRTRRNWYQEDELSAKLEYTLTDNIALQLNALYSKNYVDADYTTSHDDWQASENNVSSIIFDWDREKWEVSGDIVYQRDEQNQFKLLFISNSLDANDQLWRVALSDIQASTLEYQLPRIYVASENVLRGNWRYQLDARHSFDSGLELAINKHDENLQFISLPETSYHSTEINNIKETRYEAFVNHNFALSSALNLQSSLIYERSTMDVATDFSLISDTNEQVQSQSSRTFSYLKPRLNIRYDLSDIHQVRFNYERTVSQLNLDDFVPVFDRDETRLEETNPNLKPEMRDEFSMSFEQQWPSTDSSISLTPYYHKISDLIIEIPLVLTSGAGNVDSAKEYGIKLDTHFGLELMGLDNTLITASYIWRDSEVKNPFTHQKGAIETLNKNEWQVKIIQNELLPDLSFNLTLKNLSQYQFSRFDYQSIISTGMTANMFIDYQLNQNIKVRLQGNNLLNREYRYHRTRYDGSFTHSDVLRVEKRHREFSPRIALTVIGQL